jgi:hypothetical protein
MNWIPYKQWLHEQGIRDGASPETVANRVHRGLYPGLRFRRKNIRVVFVPDRPVRYANAPRPGEERILGWVRRQAAQEGVSEPTIWMRLGRDRKRWYPRLRIRRVRPGIVFCVLTIRKARAGCATP